MAILRQNKIVAFGPRTKPINVVFHVLWGEPTPDTHAISDCTRFAASCNQFLHTSDLVWSPHFNSCNLNSHGLAFGLSRPWHSYVPAYLACDCNPRYPLQQFATYSFLQQSTISAGLELCFLPRRPRHSCLQCLLYIVNCITLIALLWCNSAIVCHCHWCASLFFVTPRITRYRYASMFFIMPRVVLHSVVAGVVIRLSVVSCVLVYSSLWINICDFWINVNECKV